MKKALLLIAMLISTPLFVNAQCNHCATPCNKSGNTQDNSQKINWMSFEEAIEANKTNPKKIFIDVYTNWCGWCTKMDQTTFINKDVVKYMNENYHAVKFNAESNDTIEFAGYTFINEGGSNGRKGTHQLAIALLQGKMSYPSYVFMDKNNNLITVAPGYMDASRFMPVLKYIGSDAYLNSTFDEFSKAEYGK